MTFTITESAASRISTLVNKNDQDGFFRIAVNGGGCQGFEYDFGVRNDAADDDEVFPAGDATVRIDRTSLTFLLGGKIDWVETLAEEKFEFINPNASSSCGCGVSFSI
ncbi:iron-sulfur cluster assembly accessory protein [Rhizobium sp. MHM7A]|uniref:HesB/IscA family protein n=1 Tax=Rhizobium sp. MHM7A TaxID=2583233 RepID=UPI001486FB9A|nr:iron-sulfur cluster assembly accessory protein [Rhizobium sp. MHM7A]